jgi:hypothetical protein
MAMQLLDGFDATVSIKSQGYASGALTGTPVEHACWVSALSLDFRQDVFPISKVTFCTIPGWKKKGTGEREVVGTASGLASKGDPASMPGLTIDGTKFFLTVVVDDPTPGTVGSDVNSVSGDFVTSSDLIGLIARANSSRGWSFESTGLVTKAWVIA